jgi:YesN/AraC family two-component response regulator
MDRKLNVLLVDDSPTVLDNLASILGEIDGLAIVGTAQNGAAAIRMTGESRPDLVLLDIVMPGLDGLSALRTIRSMHPQVEVAMVSSVGGDLAMAEQAYKLGACQVIAKPFDPDIVEALIEKVRSELETVQSAAP